MYKTKTQKRTLNPKFSDEFTLNVSSKYLSSIGILQIECWDHDLLKADDFLGGCIFSLHKLKNNETETVTLKFVGVTNGTIEFQITTKDFDKPTDKLYEETMGFLSPYDVVLEKLTESTYKSAMSDKMILAVAESLSNIEEMKNKYLSLNWAETLQLEKDLLFHSSNQLGTDSKRESTSVDEQVEISEDFDDSNDKMMDLEEIHTKHLKENVKIKIIFIDQLKDDKVLVEMRKFFSPIISEIAGTKMGMFHSALMVGPWLLEWNSSSLCIPRKCVSTAAFLSADIAEIDTAENLEEIRDKLATVITLWNVSMNYDRLNSKPGHGNCQGFIEAVLDAIDVKINFKGPLAKYLKNMREKGASKLAFQCDKDFQKKFQLKSDTTVFETHTELDDFTASLIKIDSNFAKNFVDEYQLLKSFDRAFWMRHYKKIEKVEKLTKQIRTLKDGKFTPLRQKQVDTKIENLAESVKNLNIEGEKDSPSNENGCPFSDPFKTKSFRF